MAKESKTAKIQRMTEVLAILARTYADAKCSLDYETPFQLLCATILSAQCTDERVNMVTPALFKKYPDAKHLAKAKQADVEALIKSTGFYKNKATSLISCATALVAEHRGQVPQDLDALVKLRGVGRKTANVVRGNAFQIPGLVVDTHVGRLTRRLGFTTKTDPVDVEHEMMGLVPEKHWTMFSHWLIHHGRARCDARKPDCVGCELRALCPKTGVEAKFLPKPGEVDHHSL
jgi:endonuclease-3